MEPLLEVISNKDNLCLNLFK